MHDARYGWAWVASGAALDVTMVAFCLFAVNAFKPSFLHDSIDGLTLMATLPTLLGAMLTVVHGTLLPALVWPSRDLKLYDIAQAIVRAILLALFTAVSAAVGYLVGCVSLLLLWFLSALLLQATGGGTGVVHTVVVYAVVFIAIAAGYFTGGATSGGAVAIVNKAFSNKPGDIVTRARTALLGGGIAAAILTILELLDVMSAHYSKAGFGYGPRALVLELSLLSVVSGLPHLLLMRRDLTRQLPALAAFPVAAHRFCVTLALIGAGTALLLLAAHGRS